MATSACKRKTAVEWCLKNKVVEKASVKGDVPQVAIDLQEGASVYGMATC